MSSKRVENKEWEPKRAVYHSERRTDCTVIKNELSRQGFNAITATAPKGYCVAVPVSEYKMANAVVWGDDETEN
jgi:hypothetical protein